MGKTASVKYECREFDTLETLFLKKNEIFFLKNLQE